MNLDVFFTLQNQGQAQGLNQGAKIGAPETTGQGFLEFIMAQLQAAEDQISKTDAQVKAQSSSEEADEQLLSSDNPLLDKSPSLSLIQILAANSEIQQEVEDFIQATQLGDSAALTQTLALNQQAFDDVLKPLTDGVITLEEIENGSPRLLNALLINDEKKLDELLSNFEQALEKLNALIESGDPAVINANLTPAQITQFQNLEKLAEAAIADTDAADVSEKSDELAALFAGFVSLIAPAKKVETSVTASGSATSPTSASGLENAALSKIAARLNALNVGAGESAAANLDGDGSEYDISFDALMKKAAGKGEDVSKLAAANKNLKAQGAPMQSAVAAAATVALPAISLSDDALLGSFELTPELMEQLGLTPLTASTGQAASLTNLVTQANAASVPHPATQAIAMNIQRAANNNQNTQFNIHLDPPELGRIEISMSFGKDKTVKTGLIVEKPETFLMLQRDANALERTLQELGLESEGFSLELAEQGFDFDRENERGGGHDKGGTGAGEQNDEMEIIESTMTWNVDPETGHMRYNILA